VGTDWPPIVAKVKEVVVYDCGENCGIDHITTNGADRCQVNGFHRRVGMAKQWHDEGLLEFVGYKLEQGVSRSRIAKLIGKSPQWVAKHHRMRSAIRRQGLEFGEVQVLMGIAEGIASSKGWLS